MGSPTLQLAQGSLHTSDIPALKLLGCGAMPGEIQKCLDEIARPTRHGSSTTAPTTNARAGQQSLCRDPIPPTLASIIKPAEMSKGWKQDNPERLKATCAPTIAAMAMPTVGCWRKASRQARAGPAYAAPRLKRRADLSYADITDRDAGTADGRIARLHIPLQTAKGCESRLGADGQPHPPALFPPARCPSRHPKAARGLVNTSDCDRILLVIDALPATLKPGGLIDA